MSVYRAYWICPTSGALKYRVFHSRREANAFAALPRETPATVERDRDTPYPGLDRRATP